MVNVIIVMIKVPKYDTYKPSSEISSRIKKRNKHRDTTAELMLRRYTWKLGLRYKTFVKTLPGKPDMVFTRAKVVVFCDGDFWHGRNWNKLKKQLANRKNAEYWIAKIEYNRKRDTMQTRQLEEAGWHVLRFWETDVLNNPNFAVQKIYEIVNKRKDDLQSSV